MSSNNVFPPSLPPPDKTGLIRDDRDDKDDKEGEKKRKKGMSNKKKEGIYYLCVFIFLDILCIIGLYAVVNGFIYHNDFVVQFIPLSLFIFCFIGAVGVFGSIFLTITIIETLGELIIME